MPKKQITIADIVRIFGECEIQDERGIWMPITEDYTKDKFDLDDDAAEEKVERVVDCGVELLKLFTELKKPE